ncbi:TetR family transcriptional regulator [Arthrobacter agilis]|jgi:AcrR family transcriptional regulator|uniref:TetR family transcriptional regulator n=1 Tax=Arthrobacter agilis TaxID=37921 RepID=UPI002786FD0B|nr:TetR family transcriptional regulator [Arthrobacter agilis]MDQ0736907.1 AcrR family transcriptional regulator [Arthrobacter agilis]
MGNSEATRQRILGAATAEFAERGIAGARIDRIATAARANKAQLYAYFGNKEQLFSAVLRDQLRAIVDAVPIDGEDLPGYAVRLYDDYLAHPLVVKLAAWTRLERAPSGGLGPEIGILDRPKFEAIAAAQERGLVDPGIPPAHLFSLVIALSMTWSPVSTTVAASPDDDEAQHEERRQLIRLAVRRLITPDR